MTLLQNTADTFSLFNLKDNIMKKIFFYIVFLPLALIGMTMDIITQMFTFVSTLYDDMIHRFEYWSLDVPYGSVMNDPRYRTVKEAFKDCWNNTDTPTIDRYLAARNTYEQIKS
jgi:hypothetical protein